jgi:hypothetical protein
MLPLPWTLNPLGKSAACKKEKEGPPPKGPPLRGLPLFNRGGPPAPLPRGAKPLNPLALPSGRKRSFASPPLRSSKPWQLCCHPEGALWGGLGRGPLVGPRTVYCLKEPVKQCGFEGKGTKGGGLESAETLIMKL